jgi:serine/threonine protein kinase
MRRLRHPNIIQFIEVFETPEKLMMVMEYAPGPELFDVILSRKYFTEVDARPIFVQVAKALYYLHCMNIIHRDIKPENILILNEPDPSTGLPIAKLLDFGLSKNAGAGSEAKTFVGTPCYLAPEVEYTSKGLGGTYGVAADCWSLGAVLYVMLVARFPEFEQDFTGKIVVKLSPALWDGVSSNAKDLIRSLMNTNPAARLTTAKALQHPWLDSYALSSKELSDIALSCYDMSQSLQEEEKIAESEYAKYDPNGSSTTLTSSGTKVHDQTMVVRNKEDMFNVSNQVQLAPLLHLQRSIAACLDYAHMSYLEMPEVATQIRRGAVLCRLQVSESTNMLRKVEQTADAVLNLFPDLELAIEEGEPGLAADFFTVVKGWVGELRELVKSTQEANHASMMQIQAIVEQSTESIKQSRATVSKAQMQKQILQLLQNNHIQISQTASTGKHSPLKPSRKTLLDVCCAVRQMIQPSYPRTWRMCS